MVEVEADPLYTSIPASYMKVAFGDPEALIDHAVCALDGISFDTMVGRGLSGSLVVPLIARALGKRWAIARKQDGSHSKRRVEGTIGHSWIFVDDFVATGATRDAVIDEITKLHIPTEYVGTYEYEADDPFAFAFTPTVRPEPKPESFKSKVGQILTGSALNGLFAKEDS